MNYISFALNGVENAKHTILARICEFLLRDICMAQGCQTISNRRAYIWISLAPVCIKQNHLHHSFSSYFLIFPHIWNHCIGVWSDFSKTESSVGSGSLLCCISDPTQYLLAKMTVLNIIEIILINLFKNCEDCV